MAKKKTRYPKRKGQIIKGSIIGFFILVLIGAGVYAWNSWDKYSKSYVMTFDGEKIRVEEYQYYLLETMSYYSSMGILDYLDENTIRSMSYSQLTNFLVMEKEAKKLGITFTEEEWATLAGYVEEFNQSFEDSDTSRLDLTDERLKELMSSNILYSKLYEETTKDYTVDETDFKTNYEQYLSDNKYIGIDTEVKYVMTYTQEDAEGAREKLLAGADIDEVIKEYSTSYDEDTPISVYSLNDLGLGEDETDKIMSLKVSEISEVINYPDEEHFTVFRIENITVRPDEEVEAEYREDYISQKKDALFNDQLEKWKNEASIVPNKKVYDAGDTDESS